jgi:hypothetical protein
MGNKESRKAGEIFIRGFMDSLLNQQAAGNSGANKVLIVWQKSNTLSAWKQSP